jgi:hypothetical protein
MIIGWKIKIRLRIDSWWWVRMNRLGRKRIMGLWEKLNGYVVVVVGVDGRRR